MTLASHGDMFQSVPRATIGRSCVWRQRKRLQSGEITPNRVASTKVVYESGRELRTGVS